ncbi:hypothetical protein LRS06_09825 [Hymenobacter sp. J193]|uniref:hypothetical protein n=1 Tax=Hymenobacter sp. J193 TaxID=2898429 RepID=UPI0021518BD2|nr:hypothetical protein [Hymenobacter sp. J193]MCR5888066.1 hypothetical protein [Hymenobacter sp. J193]
MNPLGEITSNYSIEDINHFLNRHVRDKKLVNRDGQFGEKDEEEDDFPIEDGTREPEESDEDFMRRTSKEARKKGAAPEEDVLGAAAPEETE